MLPDPLFRLGGQPVTLASIAVALAVAISTLLISAAVQRAVGRLFAGRAAARAGSVAAAQRLLHYAVLATGFALALDQLGLNLSTLFAAGAVFAVGLGFAMQNIAQNFVSGVILLLERSIKPGDVLEVDGRFVRVRDMGIRTTIAQTLDDEEIIIPNSAIVQSTVKNFTLADSSYRLRVTVGVVYSSDMELVRATLERVAAEADWRNTDKMPLVLMTEFADSAVVYEVSIWMDDPWQMRKARSRLNEAIFSACRKAGITIAFPQLDLHLDPEVSRALASSTEKSR